MAETKTNAVRIVERNKIPCTLHTYDHSDGLIDGAAVARKVGMDPKQVYKTLVTRGASRNLYVFVIPVEQELDLKKAAKASGEKSIEMIKVSEINGLTGYIRGGCSPIGMKKRYPTFLHADARQLETMAVSAGRIGLQMELSPQSLAELTEAVFCDLTQEHKQI